MFFVQAVQTVYGSDGSSVLYSDFKDYIIDLRIERKLGRFKPHVQNKIRKGHKARRKTFRKGDLYCGGSPV